MKISVKALLWATFCLLMSAGSASAQEEAEPKWKIGGWLTNSYTWNPSNPNNRFNGPVTFTDRSNEFQMNQAYTYFEGTTDTGGNGFDIGGRVDLLYGTDHRFTTSTGLETNGDLTQNWNGNNRFYGLAMPQFYAEIAYNDLKTKIGHFYSPVGFFVVPSTGNFFNTMPYTFQYGEPFTHTGFLSTYQITDDLALGGGLIKGWDNFDNSFNPHVGWLDTMTWTINEKSSLAIVHTISQEASNSSTAGGFSQRFLQTLVYSRQLTDNLQYVLHTDYGHQENATGPVGIQPNGEGRSAAWYGMNQYLFYKVNDRISYGFNFEWFRDLDGFRIATLAAPTAGGSSRSAPLDGGWTGNFYQITTGPKIQVTDNLMIRPNARWDWYSGPRGNTGLLPFDDGNKGTQFILGTDVTLSF